ncbi:ABC transporter substrate-binding protein [Ureibacillus chungkukjangi]|uniref:Peptide/nickel transport system substrate-binding protein n=1 Tax=Ureibacillus chungkukjangi TaxID=1202712 RepID=A0A318TTW2_9BACL|nr:ABC transporter substrate-binding protein [Ureibacillus chungkukjangi]PYF07297.1 peptide/nickel transport system substrate-binding protein [Ureibacillus chungkukjangi]
MEKRLKSIVSLLIFGILIVVLSACSSNNSTNEPGTDNTEEAASSEPKSGGTYTILSAADPDMLDPHRQSSIYTHMMAGLVYNKLVSYETGPGVDYTDYNVVPDLAEDWTISEDGKVYTFFLREAYWHDKEPVNGRQVTAEDVVATMERIISLPGHQAALLSEVESIVAQDPQTVVFTLKQPFAPFLNFMANHFMWILPKEAMEGKVDLATDAIGTGPFVLEKWEDNVQATYKKNPNYYEEGKPYLDEVIYKVVPDQGSRIAAFRTGQADGIGQLSPEQLTQLQKTNPDITIFDALFPTQEQLYMNMERKPFDDIRIRKAISMAVDRQSMVNAIYGGGETSGPVNPSLGDWALPLEEREALQPYNPEEAKKLLAEAGYPNGFDTTMIVTNGYGEQLVRVAQWVAEDLRNIGINVEIEIVEYAAYFSERWPKVDYDMGIGYQTYFQEPDEWLRTQLHTNGSRNWYNISDPELDKMLDEQRLILDVNERKEYVHEIQRYVLENLVNPVTLTTYYTTTPRHAYVKDLYPHASYGYGYLKDVWIDK